METLPGTALIVVDVQNDFTEGGSLAVEGGASVASRISNFLEVTLDEYDLIVASRDWHMDPGEHFASKTGTEPDYSNTWPDHCVANTEGAKYHSNLVLPEGTLHIRKGAYSAAYSAFEGEDEDGRGLKEILDTHRINYVDICGIATSHCVLQTALDSHANGYPTVVLGDLCVGVTPELEEAAVEQMLDVGIMVAHTGIMNTRNQNYQGL